MAFARAAAVSFGSKFARSGLAFATPVSGHAILPGATNTQALSDTRSQSCDQSRFPRRSSAASDFEVSDIAELSIRKRISSVLQGGRFTAAIAGAIVLNAIFIGLEMDLNRERNTGHVAWRAFEILFTLVFTLEVGVRIIVDGKSFFYDVANCFDLLIVVTALPDLVVEETTFASPTILRVFRIARLARIVRLFRFFNQLWVLISGVIASLHLLFFAWVLLLLVIYVFSIFTVRMFAHYHPDNTEVQRYFRNVPTGMFTLLQVVTTEEWPDIAKVLMAAEPFSIFVILLFMSLTTFAMVNVIVALVVDSTLAKANELRTDIHKLQEAGQVRALRGVQDVFQTADVDFSGTLTKAEFQNALKLTEIQTILREANIDLQDVDELFDVLDADESGQLNPEEFVDGFLRARGEAKGRDFLELHCQLWKCHRNSWLEVVRLGERMLDLEAEQAASDARLATGIGSIESTMQEYIRKMEVVFRSFDRPDGDAHSLSIGYPEQDKETSRRRASSCSQPSLDVGAKPRVPKDKAYEFLGLNAAGLVTSSSTADILDEAVRLLDDLEDRESGAPKVPA